MLLLQRERAFQTEKRYMKDKKGNSSANKQHAKLIKGLQNSDFLFLTSKLTHGWVVNSDATSHITSNKSVFAEFNENHQEKIFVANGQVAVEGIGIVRITVINNEGKRRSIKIQNVLYVPLINGNLLSVCRLVANGFKVDFVSNGICNIIHKDVSVATVELWIVQFMRRVIYVNKEKG